MKEQYRPLPKWYKLVNSIMKKICKSKQVKEEFCIKETRSIIIVYPHLLGDVVMAIPFLKGLHIIAPNAVISLVGGKYCRTVLADQNLVDYFYDFGETSGLIGIRSMLKNRATIWQTLRKVNQSSYDIAIDPFCDYGTALFMRMIHAKRKVGLDFGNWDYLYTDVYPHSCQISHIVDDMIKLLSDIGKTDFPVNLKYPIFSVSQDNKLEGNAFVSINGLLGKYLIGVHPGASQESKRWRGYGELINLLCQKISDSFFLLFQGPGEEEIINEVVSQLDKKNADRYIVVNENLDRYINILSICNQVVCNDSSCGHITAALRIPVTIIYGQGCPEYIAPRSDSSTVNILEVEGISCKPCYRNICPNGTLKCISTITPKKVLDKVIDVFNQTNRK